MHNKVKDTAFLGLCVALALGLAYIEVLMPPLFASVPGIKMGLPNIILIFLLYRRGIGATITVSLLRMVLVTLLFGNTMAFFYSLAYLCFFSIYSNSTLFNKFISFSS